MAEGGTREKKKHIRTHTHTHIRRRRTRRGIEKISIRWWMMVERHCIYN